MTTTITEVHVESFMGISEATFPVVDGVPLAQVNTAGQIKVGAAVLAATDRDMRIMWIQAGSLLDDASLAEIRALADEHGLQVFIERVGSAPGAIELRGGYLAEVV